MYQEQRIYQIMELLKEKQVLSNQELVDCFKISRDTARRDIVRLVEQGFAKRTHGGICLLPHDQAIGKYNARQQENAAIKQLLAKSAVSLIDKQKICFFDVSTTIVELCKLVPKHIMAYTHSIDNIEALSSRCPCFMLPGQFNLDNRFMSGSMTLTILDSINFDIAFIGAAAISKTGIYVEDHEDALIKQKIAAQAATLCVVCDDSKFLKTSSFRALSWDKVDYLITNIIPPQDVLTIIEQNGCKIKNA